MGQLRPQFRSAHHQQHGIAVQFHKSAFLEYPGISPAQRAKSTIPVKHRSVGQQVFIGTARSIIYIRHASVHLRHDRVCQLGQS